jgi:hypothetical protein
LHHPDCKHAYVHTAETTYEPLWLFAYSSPARACIGLSEPFLAAPVDKAVSVKSHRPVDGNHHNRQDHSLDGLLLENYDHQDAEHNRGKGGPVQRPAPRRRSIEASLPRVFGSLRLLIGLLSAAGTTGTLDHAGLGAPVLSPALSVCLSHLL